MKRVLSFVLVFSLLLCLIPCVFADDEVQAEPENQSETAPAPIITTFEELQTAIESADDGDELLVGDTIMVNEDYTIGDDTKKITLLRCDGFVKCFMEFQNCSATVCNMVFNGQNNESVFSCLAAERSNISLTNCEFRDNMRGVVGMAASCSGVFENCSFERNGMYAISMGSNSSIDIKGCVFSDNTGSDSIIYIDGQADIENCDFSCNTIQSVGGIIMISSDSIANIKDCSVTGNQLLQQQTSDSIIDEMDGIERPTPCSAVVFNFGSLRLSNCLLSGNLYSENDCDITSRNGGTTEIINSLEEMAILYGNHGLSFDSITSDGEPLDLPLSAYQGNISFTSSKGSNPGEDPDDHSDNSPEQPETPSEPPNNPDDTEDTEQPQTPYTPPQRPTRPIVLPQPTPAPEVAEEPSEDPAPMTILRCGEAVIDTSRSVILQGYDDGLLHENDPLTRAQLATIIYRLIDGDSLSEQGERSIVFTDVLPGSWYYPYVTAIANAGIVNGVGGGRYDPAGLVTWAQILTVMSRFTDPQPYDLQNIQYDGWAIDAIQTAVALGWIEDNAMFDPDTVIDRGTFANLVNEILSIYREG